MKRKWRKAILISALIFSILFGAGYLFLQFLKSKLKEELSGCVLESKNFHTIIDFEYVNKWIIVKVKLDGSDKEYPFIFDTGAQTVILDSLKKEIFPGISKIRSGENKDSSKHAFKNEIIKLKRLTIEGVSFRDVGAITAKNADWGMLNCISAYGIIGNNVIQKCSYQIDYIKKKIILTDQIGTLINKDEIFWINYKPSASTSTPVIPAVINGNTNITLFFDTGFSGGIRLSSSDLYETVIRNYPDQIAKYKYSQTVCIRGESSRPVRSILFKATSISIGRKTLNDIGLHIDDSPEKEFSGTIGNRFLENYIVTFDNKNKRIGFITNRQSEPADFYGYGLGYQPSENSIKVTSVYDDSEARIQGIVPGDEIYSINNIRISDLPAEIFCKLYRNDFQLTSKEDSILQLEIQKNGVIKKFSFRKYKMI